MTTREFLSVCDTINPVWINHDGECDYYANSVDALELLTESELRAQVTYITIDGNNELTIEIE